jgi:hypothetical protein
MKIIFKILFCFFTYIIITSFQNDNDIITWNKNRKLSWNDFQGKISNDKIYEVINVNNENEEDGARSRVAIALNFQCKAGKANHIITTEFEKNNSWVIPSRKTEDLLNHEQIHFDIAEIFARKLRSKLSTLKSPCDRSSVLTLYQSIDNELVDFQKQYDIETSHGTSKNKQQEWSSKVNNLLLVPN